MKTSTIRFATSGLLLGFATAALVGGAFAQEPEPATKVRKAAKQAATERGEWADPNPTAPAGTKYRTCFSQTISGPYSYLVWLPPDYDTSPTKRYPVIYWLHGGGGSQRTGEYFVKDYSDAIKSGHAPAAILILVNGVGGSCFCDAKDGTKPVETAIVKDLIPHVDATYRTLARREMRAIEGFSMGGFGALHLGLKFPELFGSVTALAHAPIRPNSDWPRVEQVFQRGPFLGDVEYFNRNDPFQLVEQNLDRIRGRTALRFIVGDQDNPNTQARTREFHEKARKLGLDSDLTIVPGVAHAAARLYADLGAAVFAFYAPRFAAAAVPSASGVLRVQNEHLTVELDPATALGRVEDRRSGRTYRQFYPAGMPAFRVVPRSKSGDVTTNASGNRIVAALAGPIDAVWTLELGPHPGDVTSTLSAPPDTPLAGEVAFPAPFEVEPGRDWHLLNRREGIILRVEDPVLFESLRRPNRQNEWGDQWGADDSMQMMNWFGTTDLKSGVAVVNKSGYDARLSMRLLENPKRWVCSFAWRPSLERFRYDRVVLFHFSADGGYLPLAKRVRRYYQEETPWVTLRQKRAQLPQLDQLVGAVNIWVWRDTPYRVSAMEAADKSALPADPLNRPEFVRELHAAGVRKALLAFSVGRNDSPAYSFPRTPDDQRMSRAMVDEANRLGYLPLVYDNYTVPHTDRWDEATVRRVTLYNKDGSPYLAPNRLHNVFYPAIMELARREVSAHLAAYPMKTRFFDTLPARPLVEAYQPGLPPVDRAEFGRGKAAFATMCANELGLALGGENMSAFMIPHLHYNEGIMTMSGFTGRSESANKGYIDWPIDPLYREYGLNEFYRLPLFELVFHDCMVSSWHWRTENHKHESLWRKHDLFNMLYGTMPLWNLKPGLWRDYRERFVQSYRDVCEAVFAKVGYDELTAHRWLTADRKVQESVFSSGLRVIVNFGDTPFRTATGATVAAQSFATERTE